MICLQFLEAIQKSEDTGIPSDPVGEVNDAASGKTHFFLSSSFIRFFSYRLVC
jgi:hypothetical protein